MQNIAKEFNFYLFQLRQNFLNQKVLRLSFILQIFSMMVSNSSFFVIWIMFSKAVGTINGWGPLQSFGMISIAVLIYGTSNMLFGSSHNWNEKIPGGLFDVFLTKPKSLYIRITNNSFDVGAIGDFVQGVLGLIIFIYLSHMPLLSVAMLILMLIPAVVVQTAFIMICNCVTFWLPQAHNLSAALTNLILLPATQPTSLLQGAVRFIYLFVIPALLISGLPIETFMHTSWKLFFLAYAIAGAWLLLSCWVLKISIRRYESGNSIG